MSHLISQLGQHRENLKELHIGLSALASELSTDNPVRSKLAEASLQLGKYVVELDPIAEGLVGLGKKEKTKTKKKTTTKGSKGEEFPCRYPHCDAVKNSNSALHYHETKNHGGVFSKSKKFPCRYSDCNKIMIGSAANRNTHEKIAHGGVYSKTKLKGDK